MEAKSKTNCATYLIFVIGQYLKALTEMYRYDTLYKRNQSEKSRRLQEMIEEEGIDAISVARMEEIQKQMMTSDINGRTHDGVILISTLAHFDSFLNNVTKLVLYTNPSKALGSYNIPVSVLLSKTRLDTINGFIDKRAAEVSRKDFFDRLEFIRVITGERLSISSFEKAVLRRLSDQRNRVVHEQQHALFALKEDLSIEAKFDDSSLESGINTDEFDVPESIAARVYIDVMRHILGREIGEEDRIIIATVQKALKSRITIGDTENTLTDAS